MSIALEYADLPVAECTTDRLPSLPYLGISSTDPAWES